MKEQLLKIIHIKRQAGFSLVQLIIVIVILGALAVFTAPRFLNLQGEANASILETLQESISIGINTVNDKSIIASNHKKATASVTANNGGVIPTVYGYPAATEVAFEAFLDVIISSSATPDIDGFNIDEVTTAGTVVIYPNNYVAQDNCRIEYTQAERANSNTHSVIITPPKITLVITGC
ncbi:MSHA pilin protein MshA [Pseudoalteromonas sp. BSi20652]|uniref:type II secretion system protein n=1 Tax=Pseudoalteromonas sp. BSi20652 TaxID=388384 RepID=UPI0002316AA6|nr:type II secretion system protein [Pseudoalteromonas sp. BSi20652]GAA59741.1 MSHA pilin protein MshA [Pseudoalteromonas sp. BSi20652]